MTLAVKHPWFWFALLLFTLLVVFHFAAETAAAQAVQLPTFNSFSVSTTVLVPDRGATYLGGVNRSSSGRTSQGIPGLSGRPFTNSATGRSTGGSNAWITAEIHDLEAMDRALLGDDALATKSTTSRGPGPWRNPQAVAQQAVKPGTTLSQSKPASVAALRAEASAEDARREQAAAAELARGRELLAEGKTGVAKIYFENAARRGAGETKRQALAALESIGQGKAAKVAER